MAVIMCPSTDDEHAPFSHKLIVPNTVVVNHGIIRIPGTSPQMMVVCTYCDHWIERVVTRCRCRVGCHTWAAKRKDELEAEIRRLARKSQVH